MIHSASFFATGSVMALFATSATASLFLRVPSITCLTRAISAAEVEVDGATENGPAGGRPSGWKVARLANSEPRKPTPAWAKDDRPLGSAAACFEGCGAICIGGCAKPWCAKPWAVGLLAGLRISLALWTAVLADA